MTGIRRVTDLHLLMQWRREVIAEVFDVSPSEELLSANERYYQTHIGDSLHQAFIVSDNGVDIGCGSICFSDELPSPDNPDGKCAYLMNIYIRRPYRHLGHADRLVNHLIDVARQSGCGKIYLETTAMARNLYKSVGFKKMENMMKI